MKTLHSLGEILEECGGAPTLGLSENSLMRTILLFRIEGRRSYEFQAAAVEDGPSDIAAKARRIDLTTQEGQDCLSFGDEKEPMHHRHFLTRSA